MKPMLTVLLLFAIAWACSGCALVAAGVVGGVIVHDCEVYGDCYLARDHHHMMSRSMPQPHKVSETDTLRYPRHR